MLPTQVCRSNRPRCLFTTLLIIIAVNILHMLETHRTDASFLTTSDSSVQAEPKAGTAKTPSVLSHDQKSLRSLTSRSLDKGKTVELMSHAELLRVDSVETALRQATKDFDRAAAIYTGSADFANAATAFLKSGDTYFSLNEYAEAVARYKNAQLNAAKIKNWSDEARALSRIARVHSYLGRNDLAQKQLNEAA